jgi:hypothetical protein
MVTEEKRYEGELEIFRNQAVPQSRSILSLSRISSAANLNSLSEQGPWTCWRGKRLG